MRRKKFEFQFVYKDVLEDSKIKTHNIMKQKQNVGGYERLKIGSHIRKWRNIKEVKQKDLASALRISEAAISNIENDQTDVSLSQLEDISIALELELNELFIDPQEVMEKRIKNTIPESQQKIMLEPEWFYTLIGNLQKKDEHIKEVIDRFLLNLDHHKTTAGPKH
jgi:transcriptional regulator with XRE-family HTH domain